MQPDEGGTDAAILRETPEEAARAIASALEFLRDEAAAIGMRDVRVLLWLAHSRTRAYCPPASKVPEQP